MFLKPRRFGKSLLCSILQCYYDADHDLARAWNLRSDGGTVDLHRIVVFHGGDVALCEEVDTAQI